MLRLSFHDVFRATLPLHSGNEGWIGVSPSGSDYHVVVPVDTQIARGVMACNRPTDGTPFGGYSGWTYFRCPPFEVDEQTQDETILRVTAAMQTARTLIEWLRARGIEATLIDIPGTSTRQDRQVKLRAAQPSRATAIYTCPHCGRSWERLGAFLVDPDVRFQRYRAHPDDFRKGVYVFSHGCGGPIEVPVVRLARPRFPGKSLIGSHACPGMCSYETSLASCAAVCEGSLYRRVAAKLRRPK